MGPACPDTLRFLWWSLEALRAEVAPKRSFIDTPSGRVDCGGVGCVRLVVQPDVGGRETMLTWLLSIVVLDPDVSLWELPRRTWPCYERLHDSAWEPLPLRVPVDIDAGA